MTQELQESETSATLLFNSGSSVLNSLEGTIDYVPRVALRESEAVGAEPASMPASLEMAQRGSNCRYEVQGEIARGGMGAILKGRDTDLGRDLAIKVLLDSHKDRPDVVQRFIEEAQIGGQLQHPGIAPVYELGQFSDQRPFFSMKLVKGETLSKLLGDRKDPAIDRARFIGIFEQVCQTVAYAHSRGVIHRDLKPANIMVGAFGEVQVMDWGLAKVLPSDGVADEKRTHATDPQTSVIRTLRSKVGSDVDANSRSSSGSASNQQAGRPQLGSETMAGSVMGTPAYMPPEQALGEVDLMDERSDVFGLGAILCEILTGKPPYVGSDGTQVYRMATRGKLADCFARLDACGIDRVVRSDQKEGHAEQPEDMPFAEDSGRATQTAPVDAELIAITKQCLAVEPQDRPRDAGVLAERITAHLASVESRLHAAELQSAAEAARAQEALQTAKEHELAASAERRARKLQMGLAAVVLCVLTIGGIAATWTAAVQSQLKNDALLAEQTANSARRHAEDEQARAEREKTRAETEKTRAEVAQQQAEDEKFRSLNLLADMQTERGLQAGREGHGAKAALWFANAAALTPHDRDRQQANLRRAHTWSSEAMLPVALLKVGRDANRIEFQSGGSLLLTVDQRGLRVWDWRNEVALPWTEQYSVASRDNGEVVERVITAADRTLPTPPTRAYDATLSPDGKTIAALLETGEVRLLDPATGRIQQSFHAISGMYLIEWSPDGKRVAVAGSSLEIWNISGAPQRESNWPHPAPLTGLRFSRSGQRLVSCSNDNRARVFAINDANLPAPLYAPLDHRQGVQRRESAPVFCDDDRLLVTLNSVLRQPELHDVTTGRLIPTNWKLQDHFDRSLEVSPDGRWIAAGGGKDAALLSVDGKASLILAHANHLHQALFAPDGQSLATLGYEGLVRMFSLARLSQGDVGIPTIIPQQNTFAGGAFSPDSHALAIAANNQVVIWERQSTSPIVGKVAWIEQSWRPRPSFDGRFIAPGIYHEHYHAAGAEPRKVNLQVARTVDGTFAGPDIGLRGLLLDACIISDNASVAAGTVEQAKGWLALFDIVTGTAKWPEIALPAVPLSIAARPGRPQIAVLCENGDLLVVDATRGAIEHQHAYSGVNGPATNARVEYSPDGATIVTVMQNNVVSIRDADSGLMRCKSFNPMLEGGLTRSIAFSPDSRLLATAVTGKNMAQVWSLETGEKVGVEMSHPGDLFGLWSIVFSPDGKRLLTGHKDGRIRTFDWRTGEVVGTPLQHPDEVNDIAFTPDGRHLLACVRQGTVHVWDVATGKLAVPLLPQLKPDYPGASTQVLGVAGNRAVVSAAGLYSVLDLSTLLPPNEEGLPSLLRRAELATNQKLQVGELVPLESQEWSTRWAQLVAARQTPEQVVESLARALDEATNGVAQSSVITRASRRGLLAKLHALRPQSLSVSLAFAIELSKQGRLAEALKLREQMLASWRAGTQEGTPYADGSGRGPQLDHQVTPMKESADSALSLTEIMTRELAQLLLMDAPLGSGMTPQDVQNLAASQSVERELARLTRAIEAAQDDYERYGDRAVYLARLGRWQECAASYMQQLERADSEQWRMTMMKAATAQLIAGEHDAYRQLCERALARFPTVNSAPEADVLTKVCLLLPGTIELSKLPVEMVKEAAQPSDSQSIVSWYMACSALAAYRSGQWEEASDLSLKVTTSRWNAYYSLAQAVRALAEEKLGNREEALRALAASERLIDPQLSTFGKPTQNKVVPAAVLNVHHDWLIAELLRREAALLIHKDEARTTAFTILAPLKPKTRDEWTAVGRWGEAAKVAAAELANNPRDLEGRTWLAVLQLLDGDVEGYRRTCEAGVAAFSGDMSVQDAETLSTICVLGEGAIEQSRLPLKQVRDAANDPQQPNALSYFLACSTLAAYRAGDWEMVLRESQRRSNFASTTGVLILTVRAMAEEQLGQHEQALKTLMEAESQSPREIRAFTTDREDNLPPVPADAIRYGWFIAEVLRREAEQLIRKTSTLDSAEYKQATIGEQLAMQGQWAAAAKREAESLKMDPGNRGHFAYTAALLLMAGDVAGHREFCNRSLQSFQPVAQSEIADSVCKSCLLVPDAVSLDRLPIQVLREGIANPPADVFRPYFLACHALVLYREGRHAEAIAETKKIPELKWHVGALALVSRAMAEEKLGQHDQALHTLAEAEAIIPRELRTLGTDKHKGRSVVPRDMISVDRLIPEILRREAAALIRK